MIKKTFVFLISVFFVFANENLDKQDKDNFLKLDQNVYTIQMYTAFSLPSTTNFAKHLPEDILKKSFIIKIGKFYVVRYETNQSYKELKKKLNDIKKLGFNDAFIVKMKKNRLLNAIRFEKDFKKVEKEKRKIKKIDQNEIMSILSEADRYFNEGKYQKSLNEYLKIFKNGYKTDTLIVNISYLMGRTQKEFEFEKFLKKIEKKEPSIYAFGIGSIEIGEEKTAKKIIFENRNFSEEGYLELLLGYIFEKENDLKNANKFYKKAYIKNSQNPLFIYAYARSLDILSKYKEALKYYKKILNHSDNKLIKFVKQRIIQLEAIK